MTPNANGAIQRFEVGDISVAKIIDVVEPTSPRFLFVDKTRDDFNPHLDWLQPNFVTDKKVMLLSIHSFVLQTRHHTILVDTCVGNHKQELVFPQWNGREGAYLKTLAAAGLTPSDIDFVFCTHMHVDHTGWNTRLVDGRWVPTFPNATYLFNRGEWDAWRDHPGANEQAVLAQNINPIIEADQVEWVNGAWEIDDCIHLLPTPGHTPGHCSVELTSRGQRAIITGDMMIRPVQIAEPDWQQIADFDKPMAMATRRRFIDQNCDSDVLILGTHFNTPTAVRIVSEGAACRIRC
jgi:glyoxylase-like metal-dependent hydrolase (beta-lactamase superfamily II)